MTQVKPPQPYEYKSPYEYNKIPNDLSGQQFIYNYRYGIDCDFLEQRCEKYIKWGFNREDILWCRILDSQPKCAKELSLGITPTLIIMTFIILQMRKILKTL